MFRNMMRGAGRLALLGALLGLVGVGAEAQGASDVAHESKKSSQVTAPQKSDPAWKTNAYSKTSEFSQRLALLEFSDKDAPSCAPTTRLLNEMRRKNYPIQRVERAGGGDVLFERYEVKSVPTLVLLFDGKEMGRIVVGKDDVNVTAKRLLTLFQKGRDAVAANPRIRVSEPEYLSQARPKLGFLFPKSIDRAMQARAQSSEMTIDPQTVEEEVSILDARTEEISNLIGEARLEASTIRVVVKDPKGDVDREGVGSTIHYNSQYRESLAVVASSLFIGVADPISYPDVTVEVFDPEVNDVVRIGAQCVHCDPDAGVAFVAAQVDSPIKPVAFLPKKSALEQGDRGVSFVRHGDKVVKNYHDVSAVDQRRYYENDSEQSSYVSYANVTNPPAPEDVGAGFYVLRNGRFYFAGLFVSSGAEGRVVPASVVSRTLLVNRNLTAVYRDQVANKFDAPASDAEIDAAISRLAQLDAQKEAERKFDSYDDDEPVNSGNTVALSEPVSTLDDHGEPVVDLSGSSANGSFSNDASRADVALMGVGEEQSNLSSFPNNAKDAFARSAAMTSAIANNASFQTAEEFQFPTERVSEPNLVDRALVADATPATQAPAVPSPDASRSQLAFNSQPDAANSFARSDPFDDPIPQPQDPLLNDPFPFPDPTNAELANAADEDLFPAAQPDRTLVASSNQDRFPASPYAADPLPTPNSDLVRSTTFSNREQVETFNKEEEEFEAALDALRRRGMEGAEIICIVNWSNDANGARETEVVRIPRRTLLTNPSAPGNGVQLVSDPDANRDAVMTARSNSEPNGADQRPVPTVSERPDSILYK